MITRKIIFALIILITLSSRSQSQELINHNNNYSYYLQVLDYALGEPADFNLYTLRDEQEKHGSIIVILAEYYDNFPDTINEFKITYIGKSELTDKKLLKQKLKLKETRFVIMIDHLYIDINNNIAIETPGFYLTKDYEIKIKGRGQYLAHKDKCFVTFRFDCKNNKWEIIK